MESLSVHRKRSLSQEEFLALAHAMPETFAMMLNNRHRMVFRGEEITTKTSSLGGHTIRHYRFREYDSFEDWLTESTQGLYFLSTSDSGGMGRQYRTLEISFANEEDAALFKLAWVGRKSVGETV